MWPFKKKHKRFGEILIEKGLATREEVEEALRLQREIRDTKNIQKQIGIILHEKGVIGIEDIDNVLEEQKQAENFLLKGLIYSIFHSTQPK